MVDTGKIYIVGRAIYITIIYLLDTVLGSWEIGVSTVGIVPALKSLKFMFQFAA
jgi:hypothetical protein